MTNGPHTPENWDAASEHYDQNITDWTANFASDALRASGIADADAPSVVEVAAGGGALTLELAPHCGSLLAVDYSRGMLDRLRPKLQDRGFNNVELAQMNGMALDLDDETFDFAFSQFGVMLFDEPARGLAELCRVVKPGGCAVVTAWAGPDKFETFGLFGEVVGRALPNMPKPDGPPPIFSLSDPDVFTSMMREAGFSSASVDYVEHVWEHDTPSAFVDMFWVSAPPVRALSKQIGPEATERVKATMREVLAERFGNNPVQLRNTATLGVARK